MDNDPNAIAWLIIGGLLALGANFALIYYAVRFGVLHAMRAHTITSTTGVSIVSSVPLTVTNASATTD